MTTLPTAVDPVKKMWSKRFSLDGRHRVVVEVLGDEPGQRRRTGGRDLRWLGDDAVARRQRGGEGLDQQLDRVVPRRDHQRDAERLVDDLSLAGERQQPGTHPRRLRPRLEVAQQVLDVES
jgi:hypothetical protein